MAPAEEEKEAEDTDEAENLATLDTLLPSSMNEQTGGKDAKEEEIVDEEDENMGVPTDKGYSWVIAACCFLATVILVGYNMCLAALFVDVSQEFSASTTTTTLTYTFQATASGLSTLITSNVILGRLETRTVCVVAGVLNAMATVALSQAPSIIVWLFLNTVKGTFYGVLFIAPLSMIGYYFKKRRGFASSCAFCGVVAGYIIFPPLASILRIEFGLRGALLILGAIELNVIPVCMLLRPTSSYKKIYLKKLEANREMIPVKPATHQGTPKVSERPNLEHQISTQSNDLKIPPLADDVSKLDDDRNTYTILDQKKSRGRCFNLDDGAETCSDKFNMDKLSTKDGIGMKLVSSSRSRTESAHSGSLFDVSMAGSMVDIAPLAVQASVCGDSTEKGQNRRFFSCSGFPFIDTSLLKLWQLRMVVGYMSFGVITMFTLAYMPAIAFQAGIDKTDAALLLTISGCMDLVVRLFIGFVADKNVISKEHLTMGSLAVIMVLTQFARYYTTYSLFVMFSMLSGIFTGFRQNLFNAILLDYFGADRAPKALGITGMCITLMASANHPIVGALVDATGGFTAALHYIGACALVSVLILLTHPICKRWDEENQRKEQAAAAAKEEEKKIVKENV